MVALYSLSKGLVPKEGGSKMSTNATGTVETTNWEETTYAEGNDGLMLTRASVSVSFQGDIEGKGTEEYLMTYLADGTASFVGMEHVEGSIDGKSGSFAIQHKGTSADGTLKSDWFVVPESGTDELRGIRGEGTYVTDLCGDC
jgi:hypothetical protein